MSKYFEKSVLSQKLSMPQNGKNIGKIGRLPLEIVIQKEKERKYSKKLSLTL